jgi:hypothetical protein
MLRHASSLFAIVLVSAGLAACDQAPATGVSAPVAQARVNPPPRPDAEPLLAELDLAEVCNGNASKDTTAYDGAVGRIHPTLVFSRKSSKDSFSKSYNRHFDGWKAEAPKNYELVACVTAKSSTKVRECKFAAKKPVSQLDLEDTSYEMVVVEAQTGKQIAKTSVDLKADQGCPMVWMFKTDRDAKQADFSQALMGWAKTWVAPKPAGVGADATLDAGAPVRTERGR